MPAADPAATAPVTSDVPALLMSGALDAVTSPANALQVTPGLPASTNIVLPGAAHDVMIWRPECGMFVMRSFLLDPGAVNQECVAGLTGPTFSP